MVGTRGKKIDIHELLQSARHKSSLRASAEKSLLLGSAFKSPSSKLELLNHPDILLSDGSKASQHNIKSQEITRNESKVTIGNKDAKAAKSAELSAGSSATKRRRGRPQKNMVNDKRNCLTPDDQSPPVKRQRGRPRKILTTHNTDMKSVVSAEHESVESKSPNTVKHDDRPVKRGRGRPRKNILDTSRSLSGSSHLESSLHTDHSEQSPKVANCNEGSEMHSVELDRSKKALNDLGSKDQLTVSEADSSIPESEVLSSDGSSHKRSPHQMQESALQKTPASSLTSSVATKLYPEQGKTIKQTQSTHSNTIRHMPKTVPGFKLRWSNEINNVQVKGEPTKETLSASNENNVDKSHEDLLATDGSDEHKNDSKTNGSEMEQSPQDEFGNGKKKNVIVSDITPQENNQDSNNQTEIQCDPEQQGEQLELSTLPELQNSTESNQVILIVPSEVDDSQVEQFIAENITDIPDSYIIKREPTEVDETTDDMNSLDVLVQLAVEDGRMQSLESQDVGKAAFDQMPVYYPHLSIRKEPMPLKVCDVPECMCNMYHCQLCQPRHGGAFSKSIMRIHYDYHWKKGTQYGDYNINVCLLSCNPDPHLHCPLCGTTVEYTNKSVSAFLSHLALCVDREKNKCAMSIKLSHSRKDTIRGGCSSDHTAALIHSSILVPHPSIIRVDDQLEEMRCTSDNGCNCEYSHCPLCPIDKQQFKYQCKAVKHFQFHMKHCIIFNGYRIMICLLPCCVYSHYHCPLCGSTFQRKCDLQIHVTRRCKGPARKRKRKCGSINESLVQMYSSSENLAVSYLKRVNADEAAGIISMCSVNTRTLDVSQINVPHLSIIHKDTTIHPTHCVKSEHLCDCVDPYCLLCAERRLVTDCNCGQYHCVLCPQSKLTAKRIPRARDHIHSHYKKGIPFKDHLVLSCGLVECVPAKRHGYHYHCPQCGVITFLVECFRRHLYSGCQVKETYFRFVERSKSTEVTSLGDHQQVSSSSSSQVENNSSFVKIKQEFSSSQEILPLEGPEVAGIKDIKKENVSKTNQDILNGNSEIKTCLVKALPTVSADSTVVNKAMSPVKKASQVLRCVSADLQEDVLKKASPTSPERLLDMLHVHIGICHEPRSEAETYRVQGSWEVLEKASAIILQLIAKQPATEEEVLSIIKEFANSPAEPSATGDEIYGDEVSTEDVTTNDSNSGATLTQNPDADESYWEEVNNLDRYIESKKRLNLPVRCTHCRKRLASMNNLIIHWKAKPRCLESVDTTGLPRSYERIVSAVKQIQQPTCPGCRKTFLNLVSCISHFVREVCRRNESFERMVQFGIEQDIMSSAYCCPKCSYTSMGKKHVVSHYEKAHMPKLFPCPYDKCRMEFATKEALDRHVDIIHVNPTYNKIPCELCGLPLKRSSMQYHLISKHAELSQLPRLSCASCEYSTWSSVNLRLHVINKHGEKKHRCQLCGKRFGAVSKLNQHISFVHKKVKRYLSSGERTMTQCQVCNAVLYKKNMTRHMQTLHIRQTKYPCHGCDKVFYNKRARWLHNLCHLTNGQSERVYLFRCPTCQKGFNRRWWYTEHVQNAHSTSKPYHCDVCGKSFRFKLLYNKHMASHAPVSSECSVCRHVFSSVRSLRLHMASKHAARGVVACSCGTQFTSLTDYRNHRLVCQVGERSAEQTAGTESLVMTTAADDNSEILLSDGIQYETRVVDLTTSDGTGESVVQNIAVEHLEAAQTLESIAIIPPDGSEQDVDGSVLDDKRDDKQMMTYIASDGITFILDEGTTGGHVIDEQPERAAEDDNRVVVIETDSDGQVFIRTADGRSLSEEESRQVLIEMNQNQTGSEVTAMETSQDAAVTGDDRADDVTEGYMCGFCSVVYQSLDDMEAHIRLSHTDQLSAN